MNMNDYETEDVSKVGLVRETLEIENNPVMEASRSGIAYLPVAVHEAIHPQERDPGR